MESRDPSADRKSDRSGRRISLQTLMIASLASAAASYAASRLWGAGTLVSAAATPVIVALVSEFLRRPVETVAATAKKVPTVYPLTARTPATAKESGQAQEASRVAPGPTTTGQPRAPSGQPQPGRSVVGPVDNTPVADPDTPDHFDAHRWRPHWRLAVATGLVAFAVVVVLFTVPELLAGRSLTGNGQPTTFFGASGSVKKKASPTTTVTTTTSATTTPTTTVTKSASTTTTTKTTKTTTTSTPTTKATGSTSTSATTSTTSTTLPGASSTTTTGTPVP